jgi:putative ABC transport system permease protein
VATNEAGWIREGTLVLRPRAGLEPAVTAVRAAVAELDPEIPVEGVGGWEDVRAASVARERFTASIVGAFSLLALLLASVGTYGVISFVTAHRVREVGVRLALGAERGRVVRELLLRAAAVAGAGVVVGGVLALTGAPLLEAFLFRGDVRDPVVLLAAPVLLAVVSLGAAAVPAVRAGRTDPAVALRAEE